MQACGLMLDTDVARPNTLIVIHSGNSQVAEAVRYAAEHEVINEPSYDPCSNNPKNVMPCSLAVGLEALFVAEIASRLHQLIRGRREEWKFNECIYTPSTRIESKCGFDVSVGHYEQSSRVRLMHKLVQSWCDQPWSWNSSSEYKKKTTTYPCVDHIAKLLAQYVRSEHRIVPFLSISVCFCLHEHRRMGRPHIPPFEDERRSLFIDLRDLDAIPVEMLNKNTPQGRVEIDHAIEEEASKIEAFWSPIDGEKKKLRVMNWVDFAEFAVGFLAPEI